MNVHWRWPPPDEGALTFTTTAAHAAGEPLRIVFDGMPPLNGATILERRRDMRERFDHILIDTPPGMGLLTRNALVASDQYLVPAVPQFLAVEGLENLVQAVARLDFRCQSRTPLLGIVATQAVSVLGTLLAPGIEVSMDALFARAADGRHEARSAGTTPADAVHPEVAEAMNEVGIDLSGRRPRRPGSSPRSPGRRPSSGWSSRRI